MGLFTDHVITPIKNGLDKGDKGIPIPLKKLSRYINYIEKGQVVVISGRPESGKSGLMDYMYFINVFKQWHESIYQKVPGPGGLEIVKKNEEGEPIENGFDRRPMKMFYFSMKSDLRLKMQKWLCLYLKLEFNIVIDIPTLTSGVGKMFNLSTEHIAAINEAKLFFDEFEKEVLTLSRGRKTPSSIHNEVNNYMLSIGHIDDTGTYMYDQGYEGTKVFLYVDNVEYLETETDGFQMMTEEGLKRSIGEKVTELKELYGVTSFLISPSKLSNSRMVKDSEPSYKDLGVYAKVADIGLVTYNPYNENNNKFGGYPVEDLIIRGNNRFRTVTIVRNYNGQSNITVGCLFYGECGWFIETSFPSDAIWFDSAVEKLNQLPYLKLTSTLDESED
tara:strand:- start:67 stop:1233 length:1167 start_codon:yes stop_codon:yes gene_type:complete